MFITGANALECLTLVWKDQGLEAQSWTSLSGLLHLFAEPVWFFLGDMKTKDMKVYFSNSQCQQPCKQPSASELPYNNKPA